ncbi:hypothetical protein B1H38_11625 [Leptospira borgpetersenii serovar Ballum]|nr:hypothetical protein B1H38_11625 [Leptospira borgpetersenii serovar Ballum]
MCLNRFRNALKEFKRCTKNLSQNLGCRNSYENVPTDFIVGTSINRRSAGIHPLYYELMK